MHLRADTSGRSPECTSQWEQSSASSWKLCPGSRWTAFPLPVLGCWTDDIITMGISSGWWCELNYKCQTIKGRSLCYCSSRRLGWIAPEVLSPGTVPQVWEEEVKQHFALKTELGVMHYTLLGTHVLLLCTFTPSWTDTGAFDTHDPIWPLVAKSQLGSSLQLITASSHPPTDLGHLP